MSAFSMKWITHLNKWKWSVMRKKHCFNTEKNFRCFPVIWGVSRGETRGNITHTQWLMSRVLWPWLHSRPVAPNYGLHLSLINLYNQFTCVPAFWHHSSATNTILNTIRFRPEPSWVLKGKLVFFLYDRNLKFSIIKDMDVFPLSFISCTTHRNQCDNRGKRW